MQRNRTWRLPSAGWLPALLAVVYLAFSLVASAQTPGAAEPEMNVVGAETDPEARVWRDGLNRFGAFLEPWLGSWVRGELVLGVTWTQVLLATVVLALVTIVWHILAALGRRWIRRCASEDEVSPSLVDSQPGRAAAVSGDAGARAVGSAATATPADGSVAVAALADSHREARGWLRLLLEATLPPLTLWVWIWGIYAAGSILIAHVPRVPTPPLTWRLLGWAFNVGTIAVVFWFVMRLVKVVGVRLNAWAASTTNPWDDVAATMLLRMLRLGLPIVGLMLILPTLHIPASAEIFVRQASSMVLIAAIGFFAYQFTREVEKAILLLHPLTDKDNLRARKVATEVKVLRKLAVVLIVVFTIASMLMVFDSVRQLGASILASAGVAGIIIGFAAQRSISTIVAGFQIALTQPIRIDDVVIAEGEYGNVEEITLTYVVVRTWDNRRLILPINYFIEKTFQNWTRVGAELTGAVTLWVDYTASLDALRPAVERMVKASPKWDQRFWNLQVVDANERAVQIRVLATARSAGDAWDLRCEIREKLVAHLQREYPEMLPRLRAIRFEGGPSVHEGANGEGPILEAAKA